MTTPPRISRMTAALVAALVVAACASVPERSIYAGLGGQPGVEALVDELLVRIVDDARINRFFVDTDLVRFREKLIEQVCFEAGGPCEYTGESMKVSHAGHGIDEAAFNALVEVLIDAMDARAIPVTVQNRLLRRLAPMHADIVER